MRENFSKMEQKIANYILNHPEEVKQLTTYQVAKICKTSQASIVRFAKKIGFSGYPDFKLSLSQDIGVRSAKNKSTLSIVKSIPMTVYKKYAKKWLMKMSGQLKIPILF